MKILITEQRLHLWRRYRDELAGTYSSLGADLGYSAHNGNLTIRRHREIIDLEGPIATFIALKHTDWLIVVE
jgi:hypothetical protein